MDMNEVIIKIAEYKGKVAYHVGVRSQKQCTRCGCYDFKRTHLVCVPDQWDLEDCGGPYPMDTKWVVTPEGQPSRASSESDFTALLRSL